jgi:hypothetical protein
MENTNPPPVPPNPSNPNPYQQAPGGYQQTTGYQQPGGYQQVPGGYQQFGGMPVDLPGAGSVLTLGILGIVFSLGLIGIILNIIALSKAANLTREFQNNPGRYTEASFSKVKSGKVCAIIGLSLFGLSLLVLVAINA